MSTQILIDKRFCGPPNSANGGYTAGMIAKNAPFPAEVTLRKPPPLNQALQLYTNNSEVVLKDGDTVIGTAKPADFQLELLAPPSKEQLFKKQNLVESTQLEVFQNCFVCGKNRKLGDGLQICPIDVEPQKVACIWKPDPSLGNKEGIVESEYLWAALDCPGIWAIQDATQFYLLGRIAAKEEQPVLINQEYIVMGWVIKMEGRKLLAGTAIYDTKGVVCAYAKSTWIKINTDS